MLARRLRMRRPILSARGAETLPIFDAHIHYKPPAWGSYLPATVLDLMAKNGGRDGARFLDA